jgi:hypothetical protein
LCSSDDHERVIPLLDATFGDPRIATARDAARAGQLESVALVVSALPVDEAMTAIYACADAADFAAVDAWARSRPTSLGLVIHAQMLTKAAWDARGSGWTDTVTADGWRLFYERLRLAEASAFAAVRIDPTSPYPWTVLIVTGMGLEIPNEERVLRYEQAALRSRGFVGAASAILSATSERWGGGKDEGLHLARLLAADAADGSLFAALVVFAAINAITDPRADASVAPPLRSEVVAAADRSVFDPQFPWRSLSVPHIFVANHVAFALALCGETDRAAAVLELLAGRFTTGPWSMRGEPAQIIGSVLAARRRAA